MLPQLALAFAALTALFGARVPEAQISCARALGRQVSPNQRMNAELQRLRDATDVSTAFEAVQSQASVEGLPRDAALRAHLSLGMHPEFLGLIGGLENLDAKLVEHVTDALRTYSRLMEMRAIYVTASVSAWRPGMTETQRQESVYRLHGAAVDEVLKGSTDLDLMESKLLLQFMETRRVQKWTDQLERTRMLPIGFRTRLSEMLTFYSLEGLGRDLLMEQFLLELDLIATHLFEKHRAAPSAKSA